MSRKTDLIPQYEAVVRIINRLCRVAATNNIAMDDIASDIIMDLWGMGGFEWESNHIANFTRLRIRRAMWQRRKFHRSVNFSELESEDGLEFYSSAMATAPNQEKHVEAMMARRLLSGLDPSERDAIMTLADGGSPLDVAAEGNTDAWGAMRLIKRARKKMLDACNDTDAGALNAKSA